MFTQVLLSLSSVVSPRVAAARCCRIMIPKYYDLVAAPTKVTVDDKDYLLENLNEETLRVVQECLTINNVINSKRLEMEIASVAQAKKLDELRTLLADVEPIEK